MTASVMPSTRGGGGLRAAVRGRAKAEGGVGSCADAPDRHAEAFPVEVDDRRRAERQQLTQEEAADARDPERAAEQCGQLVGIRTSCFVEGGPDEGAGTAPRGGGELAGLDPFRLPCNREETRN
jgi:hypothetical protein